jgi:hypothetical protein
MAIWVELLNPLRSTIDVTEAVALTRSWHLKRQKANVMEPLRKNLVTVTRVVSGSKQLIDCADKYFQIQQYIPLFSTVDPGQSHVAVEMFPI